ncbi:RluA family pseudouridine synthase [Flammeovirgaceae bacterium SG7u.111]|nr:RluA family pseudouridine synthase [Flammeovirgaceae bacterium SG7u.132]WPO37970.1 RluA family pseudouridine synthase [Flammeovirgaceae bacterium SG7u.111]
MKKINIKDLVLFENEDYLIINKPYDIATVEERDITRPNMIKMAKDVYGDVQACHRLDKETSGILALAKNPEAYRHLSLQFQNRKVKKTYHAVVQGLHEFEDQLVAAPIAVSGRANVRIDFKEGKESVTVFNTLKLYKFHSLIECQPFTGRMHQIRIHLASSGAPIVADEMYGGKPVFLSQIKRKFNLKKEEVERPLINRVALHAYGIQFSLLDGSVKNFETPYPKDIRALINQLEKNC